MRVCADGSISLKWISSEAVVWRCSATKNIFENFAKFTGKHLGQSFFFNKVAGLRPATLVKRRLWHRFFPVNFAKFLRTPFIIEHLWWQLLSIILYLSQSTIEEKKQLQNQVVWGCLTSSIFAFTEYEWSN